MRIEMCSFFNRTLGRREFSAMIFFLGVIFSLNSVHICFAKESSKKNKYGAVQEAAYSWLKLLDQHKFPEAWQKADFFLQSQGVQQNWEIGIENIFIPLGRVTSRVLRYQKHLPVKADGPKGDSYILTFDSSFTGKKSVEETITVTIGLDNRWRVSGYALK